ncbi:hypothetical protein BDD12DRAFT_36628 [Trichophaea hybrida]|nr:hypothetical protein BDD12DRAFT_36628 [Trichophaea hybrida]
MLSWSQCQTIPSYQSGTQHHVLPPLPQDHQTPRRKPIPFLLTPQCSSPTPSPLSGEIAIRILQTASELGLQTITLHTSADTPHTRYLLALLQSPPLHHLLPRYSFNPLPHRLLRCGCNSP